MISKLISKHKLYTQIKDFSALGGISFHVFISALFLIIGEIEIAKKLLILFVIGSIVGYSIKAIIGKTRPEHEKQKPKEIFDYIDYGSFPSIHALRITAFSIFMISSYTNIISTIIFGALAIGVITTRIMLKKHYWTDVIGGAVLGGICYLLISLI